MAFYFQEPSHTFSEYLLVPGYSGPDAIPANVSLKTPVVRYRKEEDCPLTMNVPMVSAVMQAVSGEKMGVALAREGGIAFIYVSQPIEEQAEMVRKVKSYKAGFVPSDSNLLPTATLGDVLALPFRSVAWLVGVYAPCAARVLLVGFLGGFAPAANASAEAVRSGQMTPEEADRLLPACVCSGPSFVILTVGQTLLGSTEVGVLLFLAQITANYLCAALLSRLSRINRNGKRLSPRPKQKEMPQLRLDGILAQSTLTYLKLCGFVLFFRMLAAGAGALLPPAVSAACAMLLEVCSGCDLASRTGYWASTLCCAALSVQGLSVLMQVRTICPPEMTLRPLYTARALHLPLSLAIFYLLLPEQEAEVFSTLPARVILMRQLPPDCAVLLLVGCSFAVCQLTNLLLQRDFQETSPGNLDSSRLL